MFQAIYNIHLKDRLRGTRLRNRSEQRLHPHWPSSHKYNRAHNAGGDTIGITNLFILATAALTTIIPKDSAGLARIHADIETINSRLTSISNHIQSPFDADAIVEALRGLGADIFQAGRDVKAGDAVGDAEALAITFYVKSVMAPVAYETILDLRRAKLKISRAGRLEAVVEALRDVGDLLVILGAALLSKTPDGRKADGKDVLDGIVVRIQNAVKYLGS